MRRPRMSKSLRALRSTSIRPEAAMQCHCCQAENEDGSRFCENCGARLEASCPGCGAPVSAGKKFCRSCGAALTTASAQPAPVESYTPRHLAERILGSRAALEGERK